MIYYIRDNEGNVIGFIYGGENYYYKKNIQQDIIGIYDSTFNQIVTYTYDSWGNIISIEDISNNDIGTINPYRYRSYYYDEETKLYYLNSRYYNPKWRRFINADGIIAANDCITNSNLYFYANNNPIKFSDSNGNFAILGGIAKVAKILAKAAVVVGIGVSIALPNSTRMFAKSIVNPNDVKYGNNSDLARMVKNTNVMKAEIKHNIGRYNKTGPRKNKTQYFNGDGDMKGIVFYKTDSMADVDAKYSIHRASYDMYITEIYTNNGLMYNIDVHMYDPYDFAPSPITNITNAINFIGYAGQEIGVVKNYNWDLYFNVKVMESELK